MSFNPLTGLIDFNKKKPKLVVMEGETRVINQSGGSPGGGTWGSITGTLSDQTDLQTELDGKANTTLNNLGITAINASLLFDTNATYNIGSTSAGINDLHLGTGGVINWANGNVTITHASNYLEISDSLSIAGANSFPTLFMLHVAGRANYGGGAAVSGFYDYQSFGYWDAYGSVASAGTTLAIGGYRSGQWVGVNLYSDGVLRLAVNSTAVAASVDVTVPDEAYDATGWNGDLSVPTKNAIRDKIESMSAGSGITRTILTTVANTTAGSSASVDYVYFVGGAHTVTLPTAVSNTNRYTIKNNHSAAITVDTTSSETIDGTTSIEIASEDSVDIVSDNASWYVV